MSLLDEYDSKTLNETIDELLPFTVTPANTIVNSKGALIGTLKPNLIKEKNHSKKVHDTYNINSIINNEIIQTETLEQVSPVKVNENQGYQYEADTKIAHVKDTLLTEPTTDHDEDTKQINFLSLHNNVFSIEAFSELQMHDEFCLQKLIALKNAQPDVINSGYFIKKKILMRHMSTSDGQKFDVVCTPKAIIKPLLDSLHNNLMAGHFGSQRFMLQVKRQYFWPGMKKDILEYHKQCIVCQANDRYPVKVKVGTMIRPKAPLDIVYIDIVTGLCKSICGHSALLMVYDSFSRFAQAIPLKSEKADYVVRQFMDHYISKFGRPKFLHSDNGRNMDASLIHRLCTMLGMGKTSTPPYHPNSNPCECICGAVVQLLRKALLGSDQRYWPQCLPFVLNAYNSTVHTATGYTPNSLFLGRMEEPSSVPLVPFDSEIANVNEYFTKLRRFQELSFEIVQKRHERIAKNRKLHLNKNAISQPYKVGDYVMVKNLQPGTAPGQVKLRPKYLGPYRIIKVYEASIAIVPWSSNSKLEEFYRDPNLFRLAHRGDVRSFDVKIAAIKDTKPYKGPIQHQQIIDPLMLSNFLDKLDLDNQKDLTSIISSTVPMQRHKSLDTSSDDSDDDDDGIDYGVLDGPMLPPPQLPPLLDDDSISSHHSVHSHHSHHSMHTASEDEQSSHYDADNDVRDDLLDLDQLQQDFDIQPDYLAQLNRHRDLQGGLHNVSKQLAGTAKIIKIASGQDTKLHELQQLMMSPDASVRHNAAEALGRRLALLDTPDVAKRISFEQDSSSSSSSDNVDEDVADDLDETPVHDRAQLYTERLFRSCEQTIQRLTNRLNSTEPLSRDVRALAEDKLHLAKMRLRELHAQAQKDEILPPGDPSPTSSQKSLHTATEDAASSPISTEASHASGSPHDSSGSNPAPSEHHETLYPEVTIRETPRLDLGPQPDNMFHSREHPYQGPQDAIQRWVDRSDPLTSTPTQGAEAERNLEWDDTDLFTPIQPRFPHLPSERVSVRDWLNKSDQPSSNDPVITRSGRKVKPRILFDPADEILRERALKASIKKTVLPQQPSSDVAAEQNTIPLQERSEYNPSSPDDGQQPGPSGLSKGPSLQSRRHIPHIDSGSDD
jgi:hypothetical protein